MVKQILKYLAVGLAVVIVAVVVFGFFFVRSSLPQTVGNLSVDGLEAPVTVYRDEWGIPHIFAENEHDLFLAQGYVHAQDRLWQMDFQRRVGMGRLSEVLGEATVSTDRFLRTLGTARAAQRDLDLLGPEDLAVLKAYAQGVNAYIADAGGALPLEFRILGYRPEPWEPLHTVVWGKMMAFGLEGNYTDELMRAQLIDALGEARAAQMMPVYPGQGPVVKPEEMASYRGLRGVQLADALAPLRFLKFDGPSIGSNNWVVDGSRSATGAPLLANDMHLGTQMPSVWYEIGLHGGDVDVVGFSFAGAPGIAAGHNQHIAWGVTSSNADVQDLYVERVNPANPDQVEFMGQWEDVEIVEEVIQVKGRERVLVERVQITRHGPILNPVLGDDYSEADPLALRWSTLDGDQLITALLRLSKAGNLDQFHDALSFWRIAGQNFVYADREGNIAYQLGGTIPIRAAGDGSVPVPGWTGEYEWTGFVPFEEYPASVNPAAGYVASANNKIAPDDYAYLIGVDYAAPYRAQRIAELIESKPQLSVADFAAIHGDIRPVTSDIFTPVLLQDVTLKADDPEALHEALALMQGWDGQMGAESPAALISEMFYLALVVETVSDELTTQGLTTLADEYVESFANPHRMMMQELIDRPDDPWWDDQRTPEVVEIRPDIVNRAFENAIITLAGRLGNKPAEWHWGDLHWTNFDHPLGAVAPLDRIFNKAVPARGSSFTVNTGSVSYPGLEMNHGVSQRMIVDLGDLSNSLFVNTTGQSGQAFDPHYGDMIEAWQDVEYHSLPLERDAVEALAKTTLTLKPR